MAMDLRTEDVITRPYLDPRVCHGLLYSPTTPLTITAATLKARRMLHGASLLPIKQSYAMCQSVAHKVIMYFSYPFIFLACVGSWYSWSDLWLPTRRFQVQSPAWSRVELWATFFRHTVRGRLSSLSMILSRDLRESTHLSIRVG